MAALGFDHIAYTSNDKSGRWFFFSNRPDWKTEYFKKKLHLNQLERYSLTTQDRESFSIWSKNQATLTAEFKGESKKYNFDDGIYYTRQSKLGDSIESFTLTVKNQQIDDKILIEHIHAIQLAANLMKNRISQAFPNHSYLDFDKHFDYDNDLMLPLDNIAEKNNYSYSIKNMEKIEKSMGITQAESTCLQLLLKGLSSKLIANSLNKSPRTIDLHIEKIKHKLNCSSRIEVISLFS
ncbi:helix-turn-helix transcriptional regulator [Piscirickettsia litoralis]|uniref:HTH luxR-type domain-containing protein n=1 Tax=Piscirickettsia litoralis TaxID=1891921 RepID=A0ABX3A7G1_9GAMM|nr:LuxR C-terminal-related transcriptional regulator [Piscirickettsia litoralis]ODN43568.1 hypothetical protein BGC07_12410 [Piscirickettsia litoralis]